MLLLLDTQCGRRSVFQRVSVGGGARRQRSAHGRAAIMRMEVETLELGEQQIVVERKFRDGIGKLIVRDDGHFVVGPESARDRGQALLHRVGGLDREIVVNQYDGGERIRVGGKENNLLFHVVTEDAEFVALQIADQRAVPILDGHRDNHQVRADFDGVARVSGLFLIPRWSCRRGALRLTGLRLRCLHNWNLRRRAGRRGWGHLARLNGLGLLLLGPRAGRLACSRKSAEK